MVRLLPRLVESRSKAKYLYLLKDRKVERWYLNVARGSQITADVYLRRLGFFCSDRGLTPGQLARLSEQKSVQAKEILDFIRDKMKHSLSKAD